MRIRFVQKLIDKLRHKNRGKIIGQNNKISIDKSDRERFNIKIEGDNNEIIVKKMYQNTKGLININLCGDNCKIIINENLSVGTLFKITMGQNHPYFGKINNATFIIEENVSIGNINYVTYNSNSRCVIEKNCLFADYINLWNTDAHPIFDKSSGKIINKVKEMIIGEHSWIGMGASILKNSIVPKHSIVGWNAVYSGIKEKSYCAYAGNPAKCVKENVDWDVNGFKYGYIDNEIGD